MSNVFREVASPYMWSGIDAFEDLNDAQEESLIEAGIVDLPLAEQYELIEEIDSDKYGIMSKLLKAILNEENTFELVKYINANRSELSKALHSSGMCARLVDKYDDIYAAEQPKIEEYNSSRAHGYED